MIKFYISELKNTKRAILQMQKEVEDSYDELSSIVGKITMQVRMRQDIDDTLAFAMKRLKWEKDYLQSLANMVEECLNGYIEAEKIREFPTFTSYVEQDDIVGSLLETITK